MSQLSSVLGDADTFREIFFEETREHLANVETILLRAHQWANLSARRRCRLAALAHARKPLAAR